MNAATGNEWVSIKNTNIIMLVVLEEKSGDHQSQQVSMAKK